MLDFYTTEYPCMYSTASFALAMAAIDTACLGLLYFLVDVRKKNSQNEQLGERQQSFLSQWSFWTGAPLTFLGTNPILLYLAHSIFQNSLPLTLINFLPNTHWSHLTYSLCGVAFWILVAYVLYKNKIFVSI